jgi:hypothetical protein
VIALSISVKYISDDPELKLAELDVSIEITAPWSFIMARAVPAV